ncbi:hypothetical protein DPMN_034700 [Dreissena polymorpha]|uniref:Uncharacterized protein n=1 Tax=Dreissena polymorpha TaxID=45954 RepID=A0A9D4M9J9_DREPO|nr:hypothetical protein DPMN_034700 [Dreissena polymorpha]
MSMDVEWSRRWFEPYIIGTNLLTKFQEDRKISVASRVLTSHVFKPTGIIFYLYQDIIGTNLLTKIHEDRTVNVASRVLTRFYYSHIRKNEPPLGSHVFKANIIIFKFIQDIIETNLLTNFHEDWTIHVASGVLTRKNAPPLVAMFLKQPNHYRTHPRYHWEKSLTKCHDDKKINVTSRALTRKNAPPPW